MKATAKERQRGLLRILPILLIVTVLVTFLPLSLQAASFTEITPPQYYCRNELAKLPNADNLLYAYDALVKGAESSTVTVRVARSFGDLSLSEYSTVFEAYRADYPQHFWIDYKYMYNILTGSISFFYLFEGDALVKAKSDFDTAVSTFVSKVDPSMSEFDIELALHDSLVEHITYDLDAPYLHSPYGALVQGRAVCDGYARAFQYLLYKAGIQAITVTGQGNGGGHAWNMVRIGGNFYQVDVTWDDPTGSTPDGFLWRGYLNLPDEQMKKTHTLDATGYPLPKCEKKDENYYYRQGRWISNMSVIDLVNAFPADSFSTIIYFDGDANAFTNWFMQRDTYISLAGFLGVSGGFSVGCGRAGNAIRLYYNASPVLPFIDSHPSSVTVSCTEEAVFSVSATRYVAGYRWYWGNGTIIENSETVTGADTRTLTLKSLKDLPSDSVFCEILGRGGSVTTNFALIRIKHADSTDWQTTETTHAGSCVDCGFTVGTPEAHIPSKEWTTTESTHRHICTVCGVTVGTPEAHTPSEKWRYNDSGHYRTCAVCGIAITTPEAHTESEDWTAKGGVHYHACTVCGSMMGMAGFHTESEDYTATNTTHYRACTVCGVAMTTPEAHTFSVNWTKTEDAHYHACTACGYRKDEGTHTLDSEGVCTVCGKGGAHTAGDIDGNGKVNVSDLVRLSQYVAGWTVETDPASLDVDGNGKININDLIRLCQYVAGWNVEIF